MTTWDAISLDLARSFERPLPTGTIDRIRLLARALSAVRGIAVLGFRASNRMARRSPLAAALLKQITHAITGADIDYRSSIGPGLCIFHPTGIVIAEGARIGRTCTIQSCTLIGREARIGDDVRIAHGARVLPEVRVEDGCRVGANAVVTRSIPGEWMVLAGVPARPTRQVVRGEA